VPPLPSSIATLDHYFRKRGADAVKAVRVKHQGRKKKKIARECRGPRAESHPQALFPLLNPASSKKEPGAARRMKTEGKKKKEGGEKDEGPRSPTGSPKLSLIAFQACRDHQKKPRTRRSQDKQVKGKEKKGKRKGRERGKNILCKVNLSSLNSSFTLAAKERHPTPEQDKKEEGGRRKIKILKGSSLLPPYSHLIEASGYAVSGSK